MAGYIYFHALRNRHNLKISAWLQKQNLGQFCGFLPPKQKSSGVFTANSEFKFLSCFYVVWLLKFGHSEKGTKFEKNLPLRI